MAGSTPTLTIRLPREKRARLTRIVKTFGYGTLTAYAIARLFSPLGALGLRALRRLLVDVVRLERLALDGHDVLAEISMLRQRLEGYLAAGVDDAAQFADLDEAG